MTRNQQRVENGLAGYHTQNANRESNTQKTGSKQFVSSHFLVYITIC